MVPGQKGCRHPQLLEFDPVDIVVDKLHLLLRIIDVLICNLVLESKELDERNRVQ